MESLDPPVAGDDSAPPGRFHSPPPASPSPQSLISSSPPPRFHPAYSIIAYLIRIYTSSTGAQLPRLNDLSSLTGRELDASNTVLIPLVPLENPSGPSMQPALAPAPHPSMQTSAQDHADQVLHDQLLAAQHHLQGGRPAPGPQQHLQPNTASPRDQTNIDPAISGVLGGPPQTPPPAQHQHSSPEDNTPKSYGKRELSTSKRAAQNRAAQRAFRQRKENYIRKLEEEVKTLDNLREKANSLAGENYQLREYVINLQSRLLEAQGEVPELPPNIDLTQARENYLGGASASATAPPQGQHLGAAPNDDMNSLNRIAVAGLGMRKHPDETSFMGNNFQPNKRLRGDDNQGDGDVKNETHGLPMA